jgi:SAM-dependent methyltransferase
MNSGYDDQDAIERGVREGRHRDLVGGMWDEIGRLQFAYLRDNGLKPASKLIDIGCGSLRGGVHFIGYLDAGNYFGVDSNAALLDAGYERELGALGLQDRQPRSQLVCDGSFSFDAFAEPFDFAIAQSLFTHLPLNHLRLCLARLAPKMRPGGRFFVTVFLMPDGHPIGEPLAHEGGVTTHDWKDPFHYYVRDLAYAAQGLPWRMIVRGDWSHPRDQQMIEFLRELPAIAEASGRASLASRLMGGLFSKRG